VVIKQGGGGPAGYAEAFPLYLAGGWPSILPLPRGAKKSPPGGFTGYQERYPTPDEMEAWGRGFPDGNTCLRLPPSVVVLDVDHYGDKRGADTIAEAVRRWGELPPTFRNSAREAPSGHRFFRIPEGVKLPGQLGFPELGLGHVEILQWHHRYSVAWPSINGDAGSMYRWSAPDGTELDRPPAVDDLPELPAGWVEELRIKPRTERPHNGAEIPTEGLYDVTDALIDGQMSERVQQRLGTALIEVHGPLCRHDVVRNHVLALLRMGQQGQPGVNQALSVLMAAFITVVTADGSRNECEAEAEFKRFVNNPRVGFLLSDSDTLDPEEPAGDPIPLTQTRRLPPFPVDALPEAVAEMVLAVAEATQTDPTMAAVSALSALSACTGGHAEIEIRSGWREPLCLYTATIAHSGERKSAVQQAMVRPILDAESALRDSGLAARLAAETQKQVATATADRLRREAAGATAGQGEMDEAIRAAQMAEAIEVPPVPRLVADDVTPEAAASLLAEQGGRLAIISAEGGIFDIIAGRYSQSKAPNMDLWLKGHSGDPLRVDRKGRPPEHIPRPALTLSLMIQPSVLNAIAANAQFRGRGFLARILYAYPVSKVGHRVIGSPPVPMDVERIYRDTVGGLAAGMAGWVRDPAILTLTEGAHRAFLAIEETIEPTLAGDGELANLADWGGKHAGMVARIAGILHLVEHGPNEGPKRSVDEQTILAASRIGDYFKAAAINAFIEMGADRVTADAIYLLERIQHLGLDEVSERDMQRAAKRFQTRSDLMRAVGRLVEYGQLIRLPAPNPTGGRNASPRYKVTEVPQGTEGSS
jgi:replicative DNA helicase